ncbi:hypothetical protein [Cetobacterium sp.]|uniref:hypothetical protein n=1 Tax=Cetobacterium sp. TaxID=2071632 RepID=UPI003F2BFC05
MKDPRMSAEEASKSINRAMKSIRKDCERCSLKEALKVVDELQKLQLKKELVRIDDFFKGKTKEEIREIVKRNK